MLMRGEPVAKYTFPSITYFFFQGFALHLLCADPHGDREGGMPDTGQLLCQTLGSPLPKDLTWTIQCISPNLTLGNIGAILVEIPSHSKVKEKYVQTLVWLTILGRGLQFDNKTNS